MGLVRGEYHRHGYEVWSDGQHVYSAGNHVQDSSQPALCQGDRLPLKTIRRFCIKTAREIATELNGRFAGVERAARRNSACTPAQEIARSQKPILCCGLKRRVPEARLAISPTRFW